MSESENTNEIIPVTVEDTLRKSYLDYAMSVIVGRALPDVRDGLKPVHRRVLFAMHEMGVEYNKPYRKSARIVGDVIGKYHPHGDQAAYDTLVRMAQTFSMRYPLVDGQGNFGSIDGDSAAAMRYTEVRMDRIADELLADLDKNTVDFIPNYDGSMEEPAVLPTRIPNLLINGSSGIAVGMATNIPPHNLTEAMNALIYKIDNPNHAPEDIFNIMKGPDFPTRGLILGRNEILQAFKTGRGSIKMRARAEIETVGNREQIVISELPYQVNKALLCEKIAELVHEKKVLGISDMRDVSTDDVRIVIELKKGEVAEVILNQLYKFTPLETSFGVNMVVLIDGRPKLANLNEVLDEFLNHRVVVVTRRTIFLLRKAEDRLHIVEGLKVAVENIDETVSIIRASADSNSAKEALKARFAFSEVQAQAIMEMRLSRLTGLEIDKLNAEHQQLLADIEYLKKILSDKHTLMGIIRSEFEEVVKTHGDERRTEIVAAASDMEVTDLIPDDDMVVTVTHGGYLKRTPLTAFSAQKRGGKGKSGGSTREDDFVEHLIVTTNHAHLLFFTSTGKVHFLPVYKLPEMNRDTKGRHISNFVGLESGEKVASILALNTKTDAAKSIFFGTRKGEIKRIEVEEFKSTRNGMLAMKLDDGDELVGSLLTTDDDKIFIASRQAKSIQFLSKDIKTRKRAAGGLRGMKLGLDDEVVSMEVITDAGDIMSVTANGYGKRTAINDYREQSRGGSGLKLAKITEKTGAIVGAIQVQSTDDVMLITRNGKTIRFRVSDISVLNRDTQGVKLMDCAGDEIISVAVVKDDGESEENPSIS